MLRRASLALSVFALVSSFQAVAAGEEFKVGFSIRGADLPAVRVAIVDDKDIPHAPKGAITRKSTKGVTYFYVPAEFEIRLPAGRYTVNLAAGLEFFPKSIQIRVNKDMRVATPLRRWTHMAKMNWYAGDSHIHLHTGGPLKVTTRDALLAARAEGIHYSNLCVSNNVGDDIRDEKLITGKPHEDSTEKHLLVFGEEMRSMIYGHMQFFGISKFVEPQYTGFKDTPNHHDYPANYVMAANATAQGGVVTYGHPMFKGKPQPFGEDLTANNAAARELPVDAMLGVVHAVDLMCYNSDEDLSTQLWYRLLNCNLRLSACVGTDALLDRATDPAGGSRVYVQTKQFTQKAWLDGLRNGRTVVTNGPIPMINVGKLGPGSTIKLKQPGAITVRYSVASRVPITDVELVMDGKVVERQKLSLTNQGVGRLQFDTKVRVARSGWLAVRVRGPDHASLFDGPAFAHTSPIFVTVADEPISSREDAAYFVEWIDQLLKVVKARNGYAKAEDRQKVEAIFRKAQARYREMAQ